MSARGSVINYEALYFFKNILGYADIREKYRQDGKETENLADMRRESF